jgi:hypothetical protein
VTWDGQSALHIRFQDGKMRVGGGMTDRPDLTLRFRTLALMREFFTPGADTMGMILDNSLVFEGNMSYLFKFGHMSTAVSLGNKKQRPLASWPDTHGPKNWQELKVLRRDRSGVPSIADDRCHSTEHPTPFL